MGIFSEYMVTNSCRITLIHRITRREYTDDQEQLYIYVYISLSYLLFNNEYISFHLLLLQW